MAELSTIARPYAEAVFKLSQESGDSARWSDALNHLEMVVTDSQMVGLIGNPRIQGQQLLEVIVGVLSNQIDAQTKQFIETLIENNRLILLPQIRSQFEALRQEHEGVMDAKITSAFQLNEGQVSRLVKDLEARFKRGIRPDVRIDPALIGGVKVAVGDIVIDGSVRGRLDRMDAALKN
jgi:F-type H+-transporting ATPase subunit delta